MGYSESVDDSNKRKKKWDERFLELAKHISSWSRDPSTQVGSVIVDQDNRVISVGFNGFPKNVNDNPDRLNDRETKLLFTVHAEVNCILFANRSLKDCIIYTWPFAPCSSCSGFIVQSGIKRVVAPEASPELKERWGKSMEISRQIFEEGGVSLDIV